MKAYIVIFHKDGTLTRKNNITLEEAKAILTKKEFSKLCELGGIHTARVNGYIK